MVRFDVSKALFYAVSIIVGIGLAFGFGLYSAAKKTYVYESVKDLKNEVEAAVLESATFSTLLELHPTHHIQPARYAGSGVTVNDSPEVNDLIFMSGFFERTNELRLIRRDGSVLARWPVRFSEIFPNPSHLEKPPMTDWNVDIGGALILPDGSVVFNFAHGGLVKLDRCGGIVWTLARQVHHSVERAEGGGFWVPGRRFHPAGGDSPFPPFPTPLYEDTILKVSDDGAVLVEISVPGLLYENGLQALLTASGHNFKSGMDWDNEVVHLNKIAELASGIADDFPTFEAGDLALSMRFLNLVMVIGPDTRKVKWWRTGPWLRQHDPEFRAGGTIVVFNNNIFETVFPARSQLSLVSIPRVSNIIEIDPATDAYRVMYGGREGQELLTIIRGQVELTRNDGLLVTEFEGGRVFETDAFGRVVWEYVNRYSADHVGELTQARIHPASYFAVPDWSCGRPGA